MSLITTPRVKSEMFVHNANIVDFQMNTTEKIRDAANCMNCDMTEPRTWLRIVEKQTERHEFTLKAWTH